MSKDKLVSPASWPLPHAPNCAWVIERKECDCDVIKMSRMMLSKQRQYLLTSDSKYARWVRSGGFKEWSKNGSR